MGIRLAAVFAHPDDDTYGLGGILAIDGGSVDYTLIVATSGEAGVISDASLATKENLAQVREAEEREALEVLGAKRASVHFATYPDGGLKDVPRDALIDRNAAALGWVRPHLVAPLGPDRIT